MPETKTSVVNAPIWIDISTKDPAAARDFYSKLFGWKAEPEKDPAAGGYALARVNGKDVAGIGGQQDPGAPSAWMVYFGTRDAAALAKKVEAEGGKVIAPPFKVLDSGKMAVFQDPAGAFFAVWEPETMPGFAVSEQPNTFAWAELNARGIEKAKPFYKKVFGWAEKASPLGEGMGNYTEFKVEGKNVAGGMELPPMVPKEVPSYWLVYFAVNDIDAAHQKAIGLGAREAVPPSDYPGGRFSVVTDPQGAAFGLMTSEK
ncbi:MAG TPA: VOC family protein [Candidatus Dormibacteraeota bacterium]|nr:VOC family protein [Candidatus Dormibacteraeota bacterium]